MKKGFAILSALALAFAVPAFAGDVAVCHYPPGNPDNAHTINIDDSAVPAHMDHGDELGACDGNGGGGGPSEEMTLEVDRVRTYCRTDPLKELTDATVNNSGLPVREDDNWAGANEVVWQLIGALPQGADGEGYCGSLPLPGGVLLGGNQIADVIQDCVAVARFAVPSVGNIVAASLDIQGTNLGVNNTLSVSTCTPPQTAVDAGTWVDNEGDAASGTNPDCIVDGQDFAGGAFVSIHDVQQQKSDNNVGLIGGFDDLTFGEFIFDRSVNLAYEGVEEIDGAQDGYISFIMRCADSDGAENGFLGSLSNMLVLHDPAGLGFGSPGTTQLTISYVP